MSRVIRGRWFWWSKPGSIESCSGIAVSLIMFFLRSVALGISALELGINVAGQFVGLLNLAGPAAETIRAVIVLVVGIACIVISLRYRDDALILLSVLTGVGALTQEVLRMNTNAPSTVIIWLVLSLFGMIVQYAFLQRE